MGPNPNGPCSVSCDRAIKILRFLSGSVQWYPCWKFLGNMDMIYHISGQIIATSHDLTPNGGLGRDIPLFQGNPGWWNIIIWPDIYGFYMCIYAISWVEWCVTHTMEGYNHPVFPPWVVSQRQSPSCIPCPWGNLHCNRVLVTLVEMWDHQGNLQWRQAWWNKMSNEKRPWLFRGFVGDEVHLPSY